MQSWWAGDVQTTCNTPKAPPAVAHRRTHLYAAIVGAPHCGCPPPSQTPSNLKALSAALEGLRLEQEEKRKPGVLTKAVSSLAWAGYMKRSADKEKARAAKAGESDWLANTAADHLSEEQARRPPRAPRFPHSPGSVQRALAAPHMHARHMRSTGGPGQTSARRQGRAGAHAGYCGARCRRISAVAHSPGPLTDHKPPPPAPRRLQFAQIADGFLKASEDFSRGKKPRQQLAYRCLPSHCPAHSAPCRAAGHSLPPPGPRPASSADPCCPNWQGVLLGHPRRGGPFR